MQRSRHVAVIAVAVVGLGLVSSTFDAAVSARGLSPLRAQAASTSKGAGLRVATFNVRTARAVQDKQSWLQRAPEVAREILSRSPGVLALQELGPGRADGKKGTLQGTQRQTDSLTAALRARGGGRYRLVRSTPYVAPGTPHGTQGARILYDSSRYTLLSRCSDKTGKRSYSSSCAIELPLAAGDSKTLRRSAAYALFRDRRTGRQFFVASAHLDSRHSKSARTEVKYNALRARQAAAVANKVAALNTRRVPVIFGGDINSWQTDRGHYAPHRALVARGFRDATAASVRLNIAYPTINHFKTKVQKSGSGSGVRLDVVMVKGGRQLKRYENKMAPVDPARPSDHNLVVADIVV